MAMLLRPLSLVRHEPRIYGSTSRYGKEACRLTTDGSCACMRVCRGDGNNGNHDNNPCCRRACLIRTMITMSIPTVTLTRPTTVNCNTYRRSNQHREICDDCLVLSKSAHRHHRTDAYHDEQRTRGLLSALVLRGEPGDTNAKPVGRGAFSHGPGILLCSTGVGCAKPRHNKGSDLCDDIHDVMQRSTTGSTSSGAPSGNPRHPHGPWARRRGRRVLRELLVPRCVDDCEPAAARRQPPERDVHRACAVPRRHATSGARAAA